MVDKLKKFYSHVNYSVTKIVAILITLATVFYSHVNYSVTKMQSRTDKNDARFTVT